MNSLPDTQTTGIRTATIVHIYPTRVWIEDDICGSRHVMLQHEGCDAFCYASFNYDHRYTHNAGTWAAATNMAKSLGAEEPIERRMRPFNLKIRWWHHALAWVWMKCGAIRGGGTKT